MASYLQGYGNLLVSTNGWDPAVLAAFRADELVATFPGAIDQKATTEQLQHIGGLLPDEWLAPAATGTPAQCVETIGRQFEIGADAVILHGATPTELAPVIEAYRTTS
jgi:alkanesulfonate monooxygenase SsuD/methylene tetrahydromethanopterin reductase-like flavin-dependent oxidoreductase (luciferase family)